MQIHVSTIHFFNSKSNFIFISRLRKPNRLSVCFEAAENSTFVSHFVNIWCRAKTIDWCTRRTAVTLQSPAAKAAKAPAMFQSCFQDDTKRLNSSLGRTQKNRTQREEREQPLRDLKKKTKKKNRRIFLEHMDAINGASLDDVKIKTKYEK